MNLRLRDSLFGPLLSAMSMVTQGIASTPGVVLMLLEGAASLCSRAIPRCIHGGDSYSFPRTFAGKTTRTCCKCGHKREYDMATMRFLTGHFVSTS